MIAFFCDANFLRPTPHRPYPCDEFLPVTFASDTVTCVTAVSSVLLGSGSRLIGLSVYLDEISVRPLCDNQTEVKTKLFIFYAFAW